jgi:hypothetical protein
MSPSLLFSFLMFAAVARCWHAYIRTSWAGPPERKHSANVYAAHKRYGP